jgi:hypothetical protein
MDSIRVAGYAMSATGAKLRSRQSSKDQPGSKIHKIRSTVNTR